MQPFEAVAVETCCAAAGSCLCDCLMFTASEDVLFAAIGIVYRRGARDDIDKNPVDEDEVDRRDEELPGVCGGCYRAGPLIVAAVTGSACPHVHRDPPAAPAVARVDDGAGDALVTRRAAAAQRERQRGQRLRGSAGRSVRIRGWRLTRNRRCLSGLLLRWTEMRNAAGGGSIEPKSPHRGIAWIDWGDLGSDYCDAGSSS